jgi:RecA/RadA recombinase
LSIEYLPTGCAVLDRTIGGGIPIGKIVNFIGDKSTGKTLFASEIIAQSRKLYGDRLVWKYGDVESGYSFDSKKMYGFDIIPEDEEDDMPDSIEEFDYQFDSLLNKLDKDQILIYVLDSLDALTSEAEIDRAEERREAIAKGKKYDKGTYGLEKQKFLGQFFRDKKKQIKQKNAVLIVISQIRSNIGITFGRQWTRTGGRALDFYSSQILVLAEAEKYNVKNIPTGICTKVKAEKVKVGRPYLTCFVDILFYYGIDAISSNLKYLYDFKTDSGKDRGKRDKLTWDEKDYTMNKLIEYIEENNLEEELNKRVNEKWDSLEDSVSMESLGRKPKRDVLSL